MTIIPVILAGGKGERFWPLSRSTRPKQLLALTSSQTMLEQTVARCTAVDECSRPLVITARSLQDTTRKVCERAGGCELIAEPRGKNTAPAIALAAAWIARQHPEAHMLVLSADHVITPIEAYREAVYAAVQEATHHNTLVVFGIPPTRADTNYGYIHLGRERTAHNDAKCYEVRAFKEKPDAATAQAWFSSGEYAWNSGMFVWKNTVIREELSAYMPELYALSEEAAAQGCTDEALAHFYDKAPAISIDYGIMEHSQRIAAVRGKFTWDDVGSWEALPRLFGTDSEGNTTRGDGVYTADCRDAVVVNESSRHVCCAGLDNVVIVCTDDAVLAVHRDNLSQIKHYLGDMKQHGFPPHLF
jgi:mannose-1-phosphate guanylyltransferase